MAEQTRRRRARKHFDVSVTVERVPLRDEPAIDAWHRSMAMFLELADRIEAKEGEHALDGLVRDRDMGPVPGVGAVRRVQGGAREAEG